LSEPQPGDPASDPTIEPGAAPAIDPAPFPMGSVQAVAARSWRMCLREDPIGLLAIPYLIFFPVYAFQTILSELIGQPDTLTREPTIAAPVIGVLPLVFFAYVFGQAWTLTRADGEAHGRRVPYAESVKRAFARTWAVAVIIVLNYVLFQVGFFLLVVPAILVAIVTSFTNQAVAIGPGKVIDALRESKELLEHNAAAWCGMVAYWLVVFFGLAIAVTIARLSVQQLATGTLGFALDLALFLPLHVALLVFTACWTLFYRELQARRRAQIAAAGGAGAGAAGGSAPGPPPANAPEPSIPDIHAHVG
jgi:hypothetical protein